MNKHTLKLKKPLAFFDLETTGVNISRDRIVEISIAKANVDGTVEIRTRRINPSMDIPLESSLIHGIYDEDVKDEPIFREIAKSLAQFLEGCDLAGFNSNRFDVPMLMEEFLRVDEQETIRDKNDKTKTNLHPPLGIGFSLNDRKLVDAQRIFHLMEPRTLSAAYKFYCNKTLENAHSAEADTIATFEVLQAQIQKYEGIKIKDDKGQEFEPIRNDIDALHDLTSKNIVDFAQRLVYNNEGVIVFNFGKHAGKPVKEIIEKEPQFLDWILKNDFPRDTKNKLKEIKAQIDSESTLESSLNKLRNKFSK